MTQIIFSYALRAVSIIQRIANHKVHDAVKRQLLIQPKGFGVDLLLFEYLHRKEINLKKS